MKSITIETPFITLAAFLKWAGISPTGGAAKEIIVAGNVTVNGVIVTQRGRKLYPGDRVGVAGLGEYSVLGDR
ncbi:MAG: RNA-binding S4 domain-containing protein [Firmicutes bacterium]|nr:RNA-binding S4 domain-containing protein [Bacillota bacterium]MCL5039140.1 RNA-binding S4 domain-containing protein [Bacillota bacterium]